MCSLFDYLASKLYKEDKRSEVPSVNMKSVRNIQQQYQYTLYAKMK